MAVNLGSCFIKMKLCWLNLIALCMVCLAWTPPFNCVVCFSCLCVLCIMARCIVWVWTAVIVHSWVHAAVCVDHWVHAGVCLCDSSSSSDTNNSSETAVPSSPRVSRRSKEMQGNVFSRLTSQIQSSAHPSRWQLLLRFIAINAVLPVEHAVPYDANMFQWLCCICFRMSELLIIQTTDLYIL